MGNANGREDGAIGSDDQSAAGSDIRSSYAPTSQPPVRASSIDPMANSPPPSPGRSRSPVLFAPQAPLAPLQRGNGPHFFNQMWQNESHGIVDQPPERGIPVMITWTYGGNNVVVQGSWDNWTSRKQLQRAGKDHSVVMVLPSGLYHYKFIVDGEQRYIPELPYVADEMGCVCNLLDVNDVMNWKHKKKRLKEICLRIMYLTFPRVLANLSPHPLQKPVMAKRFLLKKTSQKSQWQSLNSCISLSLVWRIQM
ncbi:SNF1-related protein kinase regulatory subunit beta-1-like isoform X3 [Neltuma alba]|uniref:SNF1-related protein kinase regulatory subunit beta-1-like isoform X3 n=1 Tax=Neltuma alba TaxID=207710 RepID=UPI0010A531A1|nr:SNF1-related protein kinase regulatory subunit beta-1-like isoform X3 [Prosopis alba]